MRTLHTRSRFANVQARNQAAQASFELLLGPGTDGTEPRLDKQESELLNALLGPLAADPPRQSAAAEAALVILLIALAEGRALNVLSRDEGDLSRGDLAKNMRLEGDRVLSEWISAQLGRRNIPCTQGAFQSNTYRSGYVAGQAQRPALGDFARWLSQAGRGTGDVERVARQLVVAMASKGMELPAFPRLLGDELTGVRFRAITEALLKDGSRGAMEQYLVAAMLKEELKATGRSARAETKSAKASDEATGAGGDVEICEGQRLLEAIEVSAADWRTKLAQVAAGAQSLRALTIVARGVHAARGADFDKAQRADGRLAHVDLRFVELGGFLDLCSSRLDGAQRAHALEFVYACLARWHRSEPAFVQRLVTTLHEAGVVARDDASGLTPADVETMDGARVVARRIAERVEAGDFRGDAEVVADIERLRRLALPLEID